MELLFSSTQGKGAQQEETGNDAYGLQTKDLSLCLSSEHKDHEMEYLLQSFS